MKGSSLRLRMIASTLLVIAVAFFLFFVCAWRFVSARVNRDAGQEAARQSEEAISRLATIDQLSRAQVDCAMRILIDQSRLKGAPALKGSSTVAGKTVPDLHLGAESQVMSFAMVDHVKELAGGTATLFVWDGADFLRVSTNVLKPDGSRAVGTPLDRKGKAFAALRQGQPSMALWIFWARRTSPAICRCSTRTASWWAPGTPAIAWIRSPRWAN